MRDGFLYEPQIFFGLLTLCRMNNRILSSENSVIQVQVTAVVVHTPEQRTKA